MLQEASWIQGSSESAGCAEAVPQVMATAPACAAFVMCCPLFSVSSRTPCHLSRGATLHVLFTLELLCILGQSRTLAVTWPHLSFYRKLTKGSV